MKSKQTRKENKTSPAKIAANKRYNDSKTDVLQCRVKKSENINQRIDDAIRGTNTSKAAFILDAIRAKLDGPQPVQAPQPQPPATTAPEDLLQVPLSPDMVHNMDGAIRFGYSSDRVQYAIRAINTQIHADIATEKQRRSSVQPAMSYTYDPYYDDAPPDDY